MERVTESMQSARPLLFTNGCPCCISFDVLSCLTPCDVFASVRPVGLASVSIVDSSMKSLLISSGWLSLACSDFSVETPTEVLWLQLKSPKIAWNYGVNAPVEGEAGRPSRLHFFMDSKQRKSLYSKVRLLLEEGADISLQSGDNNDTGTPLDWFIRGLTNCWSEPVTLEHHDRAILHMLLQAGSSSEPAFYLATMKRHIDVVAELLQYGFNVNMASKRNGQHETPLICMLRDTTCYFVGHSKDPELVKLLLEHGASPDGALEHAAWNFARLGGDGQVLALKLLQSTFCPRVVKWVVDKMGEKLHYNPWDIVPWRFLSLRGEDDLQGSGDESSEDSPQAKSAATMVHVLRLLLDAQPQ